MRFVEHSLIKPETIEERDYQINILSTAIKRNTLVVLPTGTGKTNIAVLLAAHRLEKYPTSKVLIMAPTKPLCAQHQKSFRYMLNVPEDEIILLTGATPPTNRVEFYKNAKIISATPQTIKNDIGYGILDLSDFSLLVVDETHRAVKRYAYPQVAKVYIKQSKYPRILGLTASPGSSKEKIDEVCKNLSIEAVEIRTETDDDVQSFIKGLNIEWIKVDLPDEMKMIQNNFKISLKERIEKLKKFNIFIKTKKELLQSQKKISRLMLLERKPFYFHVIALLAETLKLWYILELLETQSISSVKLYLDNLRTKTARSAKRLLMDNKVKDSILMIEKLYASGKEHPKIEKLKEIIKNQLENDVKIIVFSHYRDNIDLIKRNLESVENCKPVVLIGQRGENGLTQKEQINVIKDYEFGFYNVLITSPIGEEGLHLPAIDIAIFYEPVPSEIRTIQRRGRVGRTKFGKIIFLLTKDTRDEGNYWAAYRKEKKMKAILKDMQNDSKQPKLGDFLT